MKTLVLLLCVLLASGHTLEDLNTVDSDNEVEDTASEQKEKTLDTVSEKNPGKEEYDPKVDPCFGHECAPGLQCDVNKHGKPHCVCMEKCEEDENDIYTKVCSTNNETFSSECELHRQRCLCHHEKPECANPQFKHVKLDYYGACKEQPVCTEEEMEDFPYRMRDWLLHVMEEMASRNALEKNARELIKENEKHTKKWVIPVIWKFCDLDIALDRHLTYKDLLPMSAPLKTLEHCTGPFLDKCDTDNDEEITLEEWGHCLGLKDDEIKDLCDDIRQ